MSSHNITTHWHPNHRVSFSSPAGGYSLDDLDTLQIAIKHARQRILEHQPEQFPTLEPEAAFAEQLERLAAPT